MNKPYGHVSIADNDLEFIYCELKARLQKRKWIRFLERSRDKEVRDVAEYLKKNPVNVFPYEYTKEYNLNNVTVCKDESCSLLYVLDGERRIYLRRKYQSVFRAKRYYNGILMEQDERSPHRYVSKTFYPPAGCVILDIGGAEGYFGLQYADIAEKVYIFECEPEWNEALEHTFEGYSGKVQIVNKSVSDHTDGEHIRLDDFIQENNLQNREIFIKVDAEAHEPQIVAGLDKAIQSGCKLWLSLCTYHVADHERLFSEKFKRCQIEKSKGYMLYYYDFNMDKPYIRKGIIRIRV